jgi:pimeloyl-ACP methyl ester carboxylesterase
VLTKFVETRGIRTFVYSAGSRGEPIIFVHGALLNADLWIRQLHDFAAGWRCFAYDLRGHGKTGPSDLRRYSTATYAEDLLALLDALSLKSAVLCGLSLGGMIAQTFAALYPERVSRLILCDTGVSTTYFLTDRVYNSAVAWTVPFLIPSLGVSRFRQLTHRINRCIGHSQWVSTTSEGSQFAQAAMEKVDPREMLKIFGAVLGFNGTLLDRPQVPTLILNGEFDSPLIMRQARLLQRHCGEASYHVVPAASHLSNVDNPTFFRLAVQRFLGPSAEPLKSHYALAPKTSVYRDWLNQVLFWRNQRARPRSAPLLLDGRQDAHSHLLSDPA